MLKKIISGGQTGADRAALDTAIKFNIDHGGWIPAGRRAEDGSVSERYDLREMNTDSYPARTEQNARDSHGTVIISRGALTSGSLLTLKIALKLEKPCCHLDLLKMDEFEAAVTLHSFVADNAVKILNVAGPRASYDPFIYRSVKAVLEAFLYMVHMETTAENLKPDEIFPYKGGAEKVCTSVDEAVAFLADSLSLRVRAVLANTCDSDIACLYFSMADAVKAKLGFDSGNGALLNACRIYSSAEHKDISGTDSMDVEDAVMLILKALKYFLEQNHVLRVVK